MSEDGPGIDLEAAAVVPVADLDRTAAGRQATALDVLRLAIASLDAQRAELAAAGDYETLARGGADVAALIGDLGILLNAVRRNLATLIDRLPRENRRAKPRVEVPNLGVVEVEGGSEWKGWRSEDLLTRLVYGCLVTEDGEVIEQAPLDTAEAVVKVLCACLPLTESLGWRKGSKQPDGTWSGLRGQGIDLEDYAVKVTKPRLATLPKRP